MSETIGHKVVFYDGDCGFCDAWVLYIFKHDTKGKLNFAPLQGSYAQVTLPGDYVKTLDTLVFKNEYGEILIRSQAILAILREVQGLAHLFGFFLAFLPRFLLDWLYQLVARHRKSLKAACPIASQDERESFAARCLK